MFFYLPLALILSYLIGSIPPSIIAGKLLRGIDIRDYGSGNAGAANTVRVLGFKVGLSVGLIDVFKGFFCTYFFARWWGEETGISTDVFQILSGLAAVLGHVFTIFASFKGGKGVNTALGVFIGLVPIPTLTAIGVWLVLFLSTGYVSLGSIIAPFTVPVMILVQSKFFKFEVSPVIFGFSIVIALFMVWTHRLNIKLLIQGKEKRFRLGKKTSESTRREEV